MLFLDEPTTGLDPRSRLAMWEFIAELGIAITSVNLSRPTLDDVFMSFTGSTIRDAEESTASDRNRRVMQAFAGSRR